MSTMPPVKHGAVLRCTMGVAPSPLVVLTPARGANIADCRPFVNVQPFGMCQSPANPAVAGNLAATGGVFVPMPCTPDCAGAWIPGDPANIIDGFPALTPTSLLQCRFGGTINIIFSG
jgi:hypothetical protein